MGFIKPGKQSLVIIAHGLDVLDKSRFSERTNYACSAARRRRPRARPRRGRDTGDGLTGRGFRCPRKNRQPGLCASFVIFVRFVVWPVGAWL
jgi:hypothetical protein